LTAESLYLSATDLETFEKKKRTGQIAALILLFAVLAIYTPFFVFWLFDPSSTFSMLMTAMVLVVVGMMLYLVVANHLELRKGKHHRYYGPTAELTKILEQFFQGNNVAFHKIENGRYRATLSPMSVRCITYDLPDVTLHIIPSEVYSLMGAYCEILIHLKDGKDQTILTDFEKAVFLLIKDKRGHLYDSLVYSSRIDRLRGSTQDRGMLLGTEKKLSILGKYIEFYIMGGMLLVIIIMILAYMIYDASTGAPHSITDWLIIIICEVALIGVLYKMYRDFKCRTQVKVYSNGLVPHYTPYELAKTGEEDFIYWDDVKDMRFKKYGLRKDKWMFIINSYIELISTQFDENQHSILATLQAVESRLKSKI